MKLKYPLAAGQTNEYMVLHALEQNERTVRGIRSHIGICARTLSGVERLSSRQISAALQRLKADGLVMQHESSAQCWFLRPNTE